MACRRCAPRLAVAAMAAAAALLVAAAAPAAATYRHRGGGGGGYRGFRRSPPQCDVALPRTAPRDGGLFAVANRGGGTVSLVDADAAEVVDTYELPDGGEPMYVGTPFGTREVWVGDRANSVLVRFGGFLICRLHSISLRGSAGRAASPQRGAPAGGDRRWRGRCAVIDRMDAAAAVVQRGRALADRGGSQLTYPMMLSGSSPSCHLLGIR